MRSSKDPKVIKTQLACVECAFEITVFEENIEQGYAMSPVEAEAMLELKKHARENQHSAKVVTFTENDEVFETPLPIELMGIGLGWAPDSSDFVEQNIRRIK